MTNFPEGHYGNLSGRSSTKICPIGPKLEKYPGPYWKKTDDDCKHTKR